jgi:hypothetical protein
LRRVWRSWGRVGYLIESVRDAGFGINVMAFIMTLLVGVTAMIERKWTSGFSLAGTFEGEFSNVTRSYAGKGVVRYAW